MYLIDFILGVANPYLSDNLLFMFLLLHGSILFVLSVTSKSMLVNNSKCKGQSRPAAANRQIIIDLALGSDPPLSYCLRASFRPSNNSIHPPPPASSAFGSAPFIRVLSRTKSHLKSIKFAPECLDEKYFEIYK